MIGVKAVTGEAGTRALHDDGVAVVLEQIGMVYQTIYARTMNDEVAKKISWAKPAWPHSKGDNHAFRTNQNDLDTVAEMLAGILPEIDHWETW